jgi:hypothetical protein
VALSPRVVAGRRGTPPVVSAASALLAPSGRIRTRNTLRPWPPSDIRFRPPGPSRTAVLPPRRRVEFDGHRNLPTMRRLSTTKSVVLMGDAPVLPAPPRWLEGCVINRHCSTPRTQPCSTRRRQAVHDADLPLSVGITRPSTEASAPSIPCRQWRRTAGSSTAPCNGHRRVGTSRLTTAFQRAHPVTV